MDVAQVAHDALRREASQGPAEEREIEMTLRDVALNRRGDLETNALAQLRWSRLLCCCNRLLIRVDSEDFLCRARVAPRQATVAAANLENAQSGEVDDLGQRGELGAGGIDDRRASVAKRHPGLLGRAQG